MTFNRQGLHIEQCEGCGGIFLDRGELERVVDAERRHYGAGAAYGEPYGPHPGAHYSDSPPPYHGGHGPYRGRPDSPPPYYGGGHGPYRGHSDSPPPYGGHRRRRSFLEGLFD